MYYKPDKRYFNNRKELKDYLGANRYKNALRFGHIEFINTIALYGNKNLLQKNN